MLSEGFTSSQCESKYPCQIIITKSSYLRNTGNTSVVSSPLVGGHGRPNCILLSPEEPFIRLCLLHNSSTLLYTYSI